ncbi:phage tail tape measure protein [Enterovirga sp.]|uniref:phage tail tape measure protein n=1 Tax=Enterovirga sp. TaxID=2026350 RepID=UPI00261BDAEA|nr:phage tail tape measure protein [Enterovirga sp.]MDB5592164.1 transfer agent orfg11 [Enterovirga sp.]
MPNPADGETLLKQQRQLETLDRLAQRFGQSLSGALTAGASTGRELSGVLDRVASSLSGALGRDLGSALGSTLTDALQGAMRSLSEAASIASFGGGVFPFAKGGVVAGGRPVPFAAGGVVAAPTFFPMQGGRLGLMGERGPEAILPLSRGPDGRLGVRSGESPATQVTVNIQAADVESFRRSEAQVAAALARAVSRGRRAL